MALQSSVLLSVQPCAQFRITSYTYNAFRDNSIYLLATPLCSIVTIRQLNTFLVTDYGSLANCTEYYRFRAKKKTYNQPSFVFITKKFQTAFICLPIFDRWRSLNSAIFPASLDVYRGLVRFICSNVNTCEIARCIAAGCAIPTLLRHVLATFAGRSIVALHYCM